MFDDMNHLGGPGGYGFQGLSGISDEAIERLLNQLRKENEEKLALIEKKKSMRSKSFFARIAWLIWDIACFVADCITVGAFAKR